MVEVEQLGIWINRQEQTIPASLIKHSDKFDYNKSREGV